MLNANIEYDDKTACFILRIEVNNTDEMHQQFIAKKLLFGILWEFVNGAPFAHPVGCGH